MSMKYAHTLQQPNTETAKKTGHIKYIVQFIEKG